jgi:hypothetical protein
MSSQISIEDLRFIISKQYSSNKYSSISSSYLNTLLKYTSDLRSMSGKEYYDIMMDASQDIMQKSSGIPAKQMLGKDDMLYYDITKEFKLL